MTPIAPRPPASSPPPASAPRSGTGVTGLDDILAGGFPRRRLFLVRGGPGSGKTTMALQFLMEGRRAREATLYITLSETKEELEAVAASHGWSLDGIALIELSSIEQQLRPEAQTTLLQPAEHELNRTMRLVESEVERLRPRRVVYDSLSELRLMAQNPLRYRRQVLNLKTFFATRDCTVLLLDDEKQPDHQVESVAHGVLELEQMRPEYGAERRRLSVVKLRGSTFRGGYHDYVIRTGGLEVFPRLVAAEHHRPFVREPVSSGVPGLDALLDGGLDRGTSTLITGPAGAGKSTLAFQYAAHAAGARGEPAAVFLFEESLNTLTTRCAGLGVECGPLLESGRVWVQQIDPAELSPGEFVAAVRRRVEEGGARVVVIDSLNGYLKAMPDERFLVVQLHELLTYLAQRGVVTVLVMAQQGFIGPMQSPVDVTYLADAMILLRYFEFHGAIKKAISVVKKRSGGHEETIRELRFEGGRGIEVGPPLADFHGVLTGVPAYEGGGAALFGGHGDDDKGGSGER